MNLFLLGFGCLVGGVIFIGKVWGKIRPMIEIEDEEASYHQYTGLAVA